MFLNKNSGGFVFVEFAIALPLLILLMYGLATVGIKIFELGRNQLADYVLEEEVHEVLSRLIYDARTAKIVDANDRAHILTFTYRTVRDSDKFDGVIESKTDTRVYLVENFKMYYKRQIYNPTTPITGNNYFGETQINQFEFSQPKDKISGEPLKNVLRITLEMESKVSHRKIKISTAIYMSSCENFHLLR